MLFNVTGVTVERDNMLLLEFENGQRRRFDMTSYLEKKPFNKIKKDNLFDKVHIVFGTLEWPGSIDIDPEALWNNSIPVS